MKLTTNKKFLLAGSISFILALLLAAPVIPTYTEIGELDLNSGTLRKYRIVYGSETEKKTVKTEFSVLFLENRISGNTPVWIKYLEVNHYLIGKSYKCYNAGAIPSKLELLAAYLKKQPEMQQKTVLKKCVEMLRKKQFKELEKYINIQCRKILSR